MSITRIIPALAGLVLGEHFSGKRRLSNRLMKIQGQITDSSEHLANVR